MADGKITIETQIDGKGIDKGLKETSGKLDQFKNKVKSTNFGKMAEIVAGVAIAFKTVSKAVSTAVKNIKELEDAYKKQKNAEIQLDQAIKNSPLVNGEATKRLREFASGLQSITTYGDEELLPFITNLINSGRSEQEAMEIMTVAADIAASGMMDLGSAVTALNGTLQGNAGTLGRQIASVKNLTAEELRQGKAIEVLKKQFAGTAEEVARSTGSAEQLKNAMGDLREEMGASWEKPLTKVRKWLQGIIDKTTEAMRAQRELVEATEKNAEGKGNAATLQLEIEAIKERKEAAKAELEAAREKAKGKNLTEEDIFTYGNDAASNYEKQLDALTKKYTELVLLETKRRNELREVQKAEKEAGEEAKKAAEKQAEADANKTAADRYDEIIAKRDATIEKIKREAEAMGEEVDQQAILNAEMTAYLEMAATPRLTSKTAEQLELVKGLVEKQKELLAIEEAKKDTEAKQDNLQDALDAITVEQKKSDILKDQLATLDELNQAFLDSAAYEKVADEEKLRIAEEYTEKRKQLEGEITAAVIQENEKQKMSLSELTDVINEGVTKINEIITTITGVMAQQSEAQTEKEMSEIKKQYADGLLSEEEYYAKKKNIEKEAAKREYELKMWEWSAGLLQIGANTAQAITKALAESGTVGIVMASLVGALGAAQLAAAIANKPIPPKFANGGIVPGTSYKGDRVTANVNSGEMILNARQQAALWKTANGQGAGGSNMNVSIKNYASNDTKVTPQITEEGLVLTVRKIVTDDLTNRRLNSALTSAQNQMNGINYGN